jgi:hypothetical protein
MAVVDAETWCAMKETVYLAGFGVKESFPRDGWTMLWYATTDEDHDHTVHIFAEQIIDNDPRMVHVSIDHRVWDDTDLRTGILTQIAQAFEHTPHPNPLGHNNAGT